MLTAQIQEGPLQTGVHQAGSALGFRDPTTVPAAGSGTSVGKQHSTVNPLGPGLIPPLSSKMRVKFYYWKCLSGTFKALRHGCLHDSTCPGDSEPSSGLC